MLHKPVSIGMRKRVHYENLENSVCLKIRRNFYSFFVYLIEEYFTRHLMLFNGFEALHFHTHWSNIVKISIWIGIVLILTENLNDKHVFCFVANHFKENFNYWCGVCTFDVIEISFIILSPAMLFLFVFFASIVTETTHLQIKTKQIRYKLELWKAINMSNR